MIKYFFSAAVICAVILFTGCDKVKSVGSSKLKSEKDSVSYAMGINIGTDFKTNGLDTLLNEDMVFKGIKDAFDSTGTLTKEKSIEILNAYFQTIMTKRMGEVKSKGEKILTDNKNNPKIKETASGLQYEVIQEGTGTKPTSKNTVKVHYTGTHADGKVFDSSIERGMPAEFPLEGVIPGWTEGIQLMSKGAKYKFYIPSALAYGPYGQPDGGIAPDEMLVFDVELIDFK